MCGIAGFLDPRAGLDRDGLAAIGASMADAIAHRGPDDSGVWADPECGIALSHRRLSVLDLSPAGHQPMLSASERYVITYNGEIYNFRALRSELEGQGARFRGASDTEVMLAAIEQWGLRGALERFNGMFAFALWDRAERMLHLARDRAGEKPLYYGIAGGTGGGADGVTAQPGSGPLLFGSELKALRAHPAFAGEVDRDALCLYLRHNYVPAPYSIYQGVRKLPPGTYVSFHADMTGSGDLRAAEGGVMPEPQSYWEAEEVAARGLATPFTGSQAEAKEELSRLLEDSVRMRLESDVPLGAFLSGGIDSSLIVAMMQRVSSAKARTFTIGFHEEGYNEATHAREVARHLGTEHTELYVTPQEAVAVIPRLPVLFDEPFSDSSQIPTFLLAQMTREHVTVSLSGDGGDELFGGYNRYFWGRAAWSRIRHLPPFLRRSMGRLLQSGSPEAWGRFFGAILTVLPRRLRVANLPDKVRRLGEVLGTEGQGSLYRDLVSHWKRPEELVIGGSEPHTRLQRTGLAPIPQDFTEKMMLLDLISYLPDDILVKIDRAAMGVSLESRIPLLDHRLIEFAWTLPLSMKVRGTEGKLLLREVLYDHVPRELIDRPKMGFGVPIDSWLRGPLRDWAEDLLDPSAMRAEGYLDPEPIQQKWRQHLSGEHGWHYYLWDILMFQAWLREQ